MTLLEQINKYPIRFVKSIGLFSCFLAMGLSLGVIGPTILDFRTKTQTNSQLIGLISPCRAIGFSIGAFVTGFFYKKVDSHLLISITMAISGIFTLALPFVYNIWILLIHFSIVGLSLGVFSAGK